MAGTAQDVEAGRAYVSLYLRRAEYDQQVRDLEGSSDQPNRPSQAMAAVARELQGQLKLLRATLLSMPPAISLVRASIAEAANQFLFFRGAVKDAWSETWQIIPPLRRLGEALGVVSPTLTIASAGFRIFGKAVFGIPKLIGSAIGAIRKMPPAFSETAAAAEKAGGKTTKAMARMPGKPAASRRGGGKATVGAVVGAAAGKAAGSAVTLAAAATVLAAKKMVSAISSIVRSMRSMAVGAAKMAGRVISSVGKMAIRVVAQAGKIAKALAQMPGQLVEATSVAVRRVGVDIAKIGAVTAGITATLVGSATLAAKSWAAYGERIRGVQNDLLRFKLTAEEASIIARVSDQTGESMENLARDMRDGTRDFSRWRNELQLSGTLMSGAGLSAALALSRAYFSLKASVIGLKNTIAAALGPTLTESAELFTGMVRGITRWVSANKPLVVQVFKIASAVGIAGGVLTTLGGAIAGVGTIITPFTALLAAVAGGLAIVEVRTEAGRSIWAAYSASVRRVVGSVSRNLGQMLVFAEKVFGGIADAVIAGDLALAVDVMWAGAKVAWISALLEIDKLTSGVFGGILQSLAAGKWSAAGEGAMNALRQAWLKGVDFLAGIWGRVVDAADSAWDGMLVGFDGMISSIKSGLADLLGWITSNIVSPLSESMEGLASVWGPVGTIALNTQTAIRSVEKNLKDTQLGLKQSLRDEEEQGVELGPGNREGRAEARHAARQTISDDARLDREREIEALRQRQAELAGQFGEEAKQEQTANQKGLEDALAAAKAARDAVDQNKLQESDFAVSRDVQSIARFSGEALGLSVGRGQDPAEKTAKLTADQLKELKGLRADIQENSREVRRLQALGGFA